jgi:KUP system potassium uptake protein
VYIPLVNWILMVLTIMVTIIFQTTDNLVAAFGISFLTTVCITTIFIVWATVENAKNFYFITRVLIILMMIIIFPIELMYLAANYVKFTTGGWVTFVIGVIMFGIQIHWTVCESYVSRLRNKEGIIPFERFRDEPLRRKITHQIPGLGVFVNQTNYQYDQNGVAPYVFQFIESIQASFEKVLFLTLKRSNVPIVQPDQKHVYVHHGQEVYSLTIFVGFYEKEPNIGKEVEKFESRTENDITFIAPHERIEVDMNARFFWRIPIQFYYFLLVNSTRSVVRELPKNCLEVCYRLKLPETKADDVKAENLKNK